MTGTITATEQAAIGEVADVQKLLLQKGYVEAGPVDGDIAPKGKTEAAILDFRNRNNLPLTPAIDDTLIAALRTADPKVLPIEQVTATAAEIAPKVEAVKQTRWAKFWAKIAAYPSLIGAALLAVAERFDDAVGYLRPLKDFAGDIPAWAWIGGAGAVAALIAYNLGRAETAQVESYRSGTMGDDNTEQPKESA